MSNQHERSKTKPENGGKNKDYAKTRGPKGNSKDRFERNDKTKDPHFEFGLEKPTLPSKERVLNSKEQGFVGDKDNWFDEDLF